ncbi:DUF3370 domain-containing protein [Synechocystis sp. LKSZ1]|uniref:DUF3370 domain-containing protein n=1 Tax=Synechocystis sp. LKSZ1 TaxID=3144951 RepID=UPI00336C12DF
MLSSLLPFVLAQGIAIPVIPPPPSPSIPTEPIAPQSPQELVVPQRVRPLTGKLDNTPVLNSNNPELIFNEGIIISTLPSIGMGSPYAHLNYAFRGRFDVFAHHVVQASPEGRTLYLGILLFNDSRQPAKVNVLQAASSLTSPDALFIELPPQVENPDGQFFSGPGSRVMDRVLRGQRQALYPAELIIPPGQAQMLVNNPLPVNYRPDPTQPPPLKLPRNGFSAYFRLQTDTPIYGASLAMYAPKDAQGNERPPTLAEWQQLLKTANLMTPRDRIPRNSQRRIYSRVAGVSLGSTWIATLTDNDTREQLNIPQSGQAFSYAISTIEGGLMGTNQKQAAKMAVRYPDTAYESHGNYGVHYSLTLPLHNPTSQPQQVSLAIETPLKFNEGRDTLTFLVPPAPNVFFRGTVQFRYNNDQGTAQNRYFHLVQKRGQRGDDLVTLTLKPAEKRTVQVDLLYPPDATPPQLLTVRTR